MQTKFIGVVLNSNDKTELGVDISGLYFVGIKRVHTYDKTIFALECEVDNSVGNFLGVDDIAHLGCGLNVSCTGIELLADKDFGPRVLKRDVPESPTAPVVALYNNITEIADDVFIDY